MKKMRIILCVLICMVFIILSLFIKAYWIPYKFAIKESEFGKYESYILIKEVHYTGTGWVQVGDECGFFSPEDYIDIYLVNENIPPLMDMYQKEYVNTFLCIVEHNGKMQHIAFENEIDSYSIKEWYPVYPILRNTILPDWMFPKGFMTKREIGK